jgi:hypothetical protein
MNFWPFTARHREANARLRDENIILGTRVLILEDMVQRASRPHREPRKDKASIAEAKRETTARLARLFPAVGGEVGR